MALSSLSAGKKLDEVIAERVLEWRREGERWFDPASNEEMALQPFSTDIRAAWQLADHLCDRRYRMQIDGSRIWQARFYKSAAHTLETRAFAASGSTPSEAICLAALAMKGVEVGK